MTEEPPTDITTTLAERGKRYGVFLEHARITQDLKDVMQSGKSWRNPSMDSDQYEALEMIAHKLGRILNGNPHYADSWRDIAGYAMLVANRLETPSVSNGTDKV
jgi:hypothetical protein